jgi:ABC-type transport system substrate-binding protein
MAFAASGADPNKVLHVAFLAPETGFDPQAASDLYSNYVNREIFDPLYKYDYLARPYKIVPNTAAALPDISGDGLTWTIKLRPGIYFSDDPSFKGSKRELTAADYVYAFKRLIDPRIRSNNVQIFDDRLVGAKEAIAAAIKPASSITMRRSTEHRPSIATLSGSSSIFLPTTFLRISPVPRAPRWRAKWSARTVMPTDGSWTIRSAPVLTC